MRKIHWKLTPRIILEIKKRWKFRFLGFFLKKKKEKCDQKDRSFSDKSGMAMVGSDTCFLEESEGISLKVATNNSFRDKKAMKI